MRRDDPLRAVCGEPRFELLGVGAGQCGQAMLPRDHCAVEGGHTSSIDGASPTCNAVDERRVQGFIGCRGHAFMIARTAVGKQLQGMRG